MQDELFENKWGWALHRYVMDSGRLLLFELDTNGLIQATNLAVRSRFSGYRKIQGEHFHQFFTPAHGGELEEQLGIEPGLMQRTPVAHLLRSIEGSEEYLFHAYPLKDGILLIGEVITANSNDLEIIERIGHLALEMSRLVREVRRANQALALANEKNEKLARSDPLTGVANRRYFMERLRASITHAQTRNQPLSLMMIDLDHFKLINDRFGHGDGDQVLIGFAALLLSQVRVADLVGRYGGEEFVVFLFDTPLLSAAEVAERIRERLANLRLLTVDYCVTASFGVTEVTKQEDAEALLRRADELLYRAKNTGRNRVIAE